MDIIGNDIKSDFLVLLFFLFLWRCQVKGGRQRHCDANPRRADANSFSADLPLFSFLISLRDQEGCDCEVSQRTSQLMIYPLAGQLERSMCECEGYFWIPEQTLAVSSWNWKWPGAGSSSRALIAFASCKYLLSRKRNSVIVVLL